MSYVLAALSCVLLVFAAPYAFADDGDDNMVYDPDSRIAVGDGCTADEDDDDYIPTTTTAATETTSANSRAGKVVRAGSQKAHARTAAHGKAAKARTADKKAGRTAAKARKA